MSAPDTRFYHISPVGVVRPLASVEEALQSFRDKEEGFIWLDYHHPTREEMTMLIEPLGLHPLSVEDCLDEYQIPKIEDYPCHAFIIFNGFDYSEKATSIYELDVFIGERFLVTTSKRKLDRRVRDRDLEQFISNNLHNSRSGPAYLAHLILDMIVDQKFIAIDALEDDLNLMEDQIVDDAAAIFPGRAARYAPRGAGAAQKPLPRARDPGEDLPQGLPFIPEQAILYYRDIYDHLAKFFELTESYRDIVTSLMEMYLSILNNQMTKSANETSLTVRRLTFITAIFMPLTLLAGIGGMSEYSMMTGPENWRIAYPLFILAMVAIGIIDFFILRWIERRGKLFD